ncbi:MAG: amino acid racemase [Pseudomonadota bacterium]
MPDLIVGVIGGLGPAATLEFCRRILDHSEATSEQDHIHLIIDNNPKVPDRNAAICGSGLSPLPALVSSAQRLESAGADFLVMPCNSAHAFAPGIQRAVAIPLLNMIEQTVTELVSRHHNTDSIGILAADACLTAELYQTALGDQGIAFHRLSDRQQSRFMKTLYTIKTYGVSSKERHAMQDFANHLHDQGAEIILAGCTEVPLALDSCNCPIPVVDTLDVLSKHTVLYAKQKRKLFDQFTYCLRAS